MIVQRSREVLFSSSFLRYRRKLFPAYKLAFNYCTNVRILLLKIIHLRDILLAEQSSKTWSFVLCLIKRGLHRETPFLVMKCFFYHSIHIHLVEDFVITNWFYCKFVIRILTNFYRYQLCNNISVIYVI